MSNNAENIRSSLWKDGAFVSDEWVSLAAGESPVRNEKVFVAFADALALLEDGASLPSSLGVIVGADDDVNDLAPYLDHIEAVAIDFPGFGDGRGFSSSRLLRERHGFKGEIRAVGNYILDQMPLLVRCGVSSFLVTSEKVKAGLLRGEWPEVTTYYQPVAGDGETPAGQLRPWLRHNAKAG
ncbi:DUF934 domain-containing protein [Cohaesibacter haloalkalitolerans]|uniref:DUF934 domain-containing protein n=1 Tax=Cohaesibacter haloalkalitolerans TaxID=1162980 RepID=UPI0013C475B1|nr:DUF934 domain-containing protein [Cohaesibacter haloalkalitolerans]